MRNDDIFNENFIWNRININKNNKNINNNNITLNFLRLQYKYYLGFHLRN